MRRSHLAILSLLSLFMVVGGCRQTTNGINGSPLTPISPLAPNNSLFPAPGSGIGPMGGSTRVPPPSTGSVGTPNNYLSSGASGQVSSQNGYSGFASASNRDVIIGSGVQSAGWTETAANVPGGPVAPAGFNNDGRPLFPQNDPIPSDNGSRPRLGGMPVIDLTRAPAPPGYRPPAAPQYEGAQYRASPNDAPAGSYNMSPYPGNIGYGVPGSYAGASVTANGTFAQQTYGSPQSYDASLNYNNSQTVPAFRAISESSPPSLQTAPQPQSSFVNAPPNPAFENVGTGFQSSQPAARTLPNTATGPSTEPAKRTANAAQDDLLWRRPGSRF